MSLRLPFPLVYRLVLLLTLLLMTGCAASSTTVVDEEIVTNQRPMNSYKALTVCDFQLPSDGTQEAAPTGTNEREQRYSQVPGQLSDQVVRYVRARHIYDGVVRDQAAADPATTLLLKGKFTRMGRFRISVEALLVDAGSGQEVAYFRQTLWDIFDTTEAVGQLAHAIADFIDRIQYK